MNDPALTKYTTQKVLGNIRKFYAGKEKQIGEVAKKYAAEALAWFVANQLDRGINVRGAFWTNRTGLAASSWYTKAFILPNAIGFTASHSTNVRYANPLEEWVSFKGALPTSTQYVVRMFAPKFFNEIGEIVAGESGMFDYMYGEFGIDEGGSFGMEEEEAW
jgi:hypothetical protein